MRWRLILSIDLMRYKCQLQNNPPPLHPQVWSHSPVTRRWMEEKSSASMNFVVFPCMYSSIRQLSGTPFPHPTAQSFSIMPSRHRQRRQTIAFVDFNFRGCPIAALPVLVNYRRAWYPFRILWTVLTWPVRISLKYVFAIWMLQTF